MGVVDKVKFMLIDSRVFAEEVEPTGLVPMELSLEKFVQIEIYNNCIMDIVNVECVADTVVTLFRSLFPNTRTTREWWCASSRTQPSSTKKTHNTSAH